jgi:hypothetical protein
MKINKEVLSQIFKSNGTLSPLSAMEYKLLERTILKLLDGGELTNIEESLLTDYNLLSNIE